MPGSREGMIRGVWSRVKDQAFKQPHERVFYAMEPPELRFISDERDEPARRLEFVLELQDQLPLIAFHTGRLIGYKWLVRCEDVILDQWVQ